MQISLTECTRKTRKWYHKLFFHLIDMCLYNAFVLYTVNSNEKVQFIEFRTNVAEQLVELHRPLRIRNTGGWPSIAIPSDTNPLRLVGKLVPSTTYTVHDQLVTFHHQYLKLK